MKPFLGKNFLLTNKTAEQLYHQYAAHLPIIDYHCHLNPKEIAEDKRFSSITEAWLGGDHYKWRAMRSFGISEAQITGDSDERSKFQSWAKTLPWCIGNPLYHWTHLELQRFFDIQLPLTEKNADEIWQKCNDLITSKTFSAKQLITKSRVELICTTDDPNDDLKWHQQLTDDLDFKTKVLPTFRPDKIINIQQEGFSLYIKTLGEISGENIASWESLKIAVKQRVDYFHKMGCRLSDHAFESLPKLELEKNSVEEIFQLGLRGKKLSVQEISNYQFELMLYLASLYSEKGWVMQLHIGALRNVNPKGFKTLGPDTGFDVISDHPIASSLAFLLGEMEENKLEDGNSGLPKTILYNLNPKDNFTLASMMGAFQEDIRFDFGKIQFGSGWWYNDQKDGMIRQLTDLANLGVLGKFIGMLTDSRSFLSYPRHEYFRRIFCNLLGEWVENGEYPNDEESLRKIVEGVCYRNAKEFLE